MIDKQLVTWGSSGNIIREIAEYGAEQAKMGGERIQLHHRLAEHRPAPRRP